MSENRQPTGDLTICSIDTSTSLSLPYADGEIKAGFPSPAQDRLNETIDLNSEIVNHPASTFYGRVTGDSMIEEGIDDGDILVIDRSLEPLNGDLAVCCIDGEFTVKRLKVERHRVLLLPSNRNYRPIEVREDDDFTVWGIVTHTIKKNRRRRQ